MGTGADTDDFDARLADQQQRTLRELAEAKVEIRRARLAEKLAVDALGRLMLVLREEQVSCPDIRAKALYIEHGELKTFAIEPHRVTGILQHLERRAREAVDWSMYDRAEGAGVAVLDAERAWARVAELEARLGAIRKAAK